MHYLAYSVAYIYQNCFIHGVIISHMSIKKDKTITLFESKESTFAGPVVHLEYYRLQCYSNNGEIFLFGEKSLILGSVETMLYSIT